MSDSTVPMAARTVQGRPGQTTAAVWYSVSMVGGMVEVAAVEPDGALLATPSTESADATTVVPMSPAVAPRARTAAATRFT